MVFESENFVLDEIGKCLLFVHTRKNLDDAEYAKVLDTYRRLGPENLRDYRLLVFTDGAGPTASQRRQQQTEFGDGLKHLSTAVVSDAITVRFVVSSLALFARTIRAFQVKEVADALRFIDLDGETKERLFDRIRQIPKGRFTTLDAALRT